MKNSMRAVSAAALAAMLSSGALAVDAGAADAPLPPGKPAGVHQALLAGPTLLWIGIAAVVIAGIVVATQHDDNNITTSTTGTTG